MLVPILRRCADGWCKQSTPLVYEHSSISTYIKLNRQQTLQQRYSDSNNSNRPVVFKNYDVRLVPLNTALPSLTVSCSKTPTRSLGPCRSARMQIGCLYLVSIVRIVLTNYSSAGRQAGSRQTSNEQIDKTDKTEIQTAERQMKEK